MGWWRRRGASLLVGTIALAGCGRLHFESAGGDDGGDNDDGASGACPAFAIFCEDFESGDLAKWPTVQANGGSTVTVTTTRPYTGTYSLDANKPVSGVSGVADIVRPIGAHSAGQLAMRAWIHSQDPIEFFDLVLDFSDANSTNYTAVGGNTNGNWVISEYRNMGGQPIDIPSTVPTSMGVWNCVEMIYTFANPPRVVVKVDGTTVLDVNGLTPLATFDHVRVGAVRGAPEGFHVFVDDVVVATQPIGCVDN